jgi:hypothetical protein
MFKIFGQKGNTKQTTFRFYLTQSEWLLSITQTTTNGGENVGEKEYFNTVVGM